MTAPDTSIAVVGASPLAWLLAGLLAADHSREVVLVSDPLDPHALRPFPALGAGPFTRPQSWALLAQDAPRIAARLNRIAPGLSERVTVYMRAGQAASKAALSHMRHQMAGFGYDLSPIGGARPPALIQIRDVLHFPHAALIASLPGFIAAAGVKRLPAATPVAIERSGKAKLGTATVDRIILADDDAVIAHVPHVVLSGFARALPHIAILTEPLAPRDEEITFCLDSGAVAAAGRMGAVAACAPDDDGAGLERIARLLPQSPPPRLAASARLTPLAAPDGAPLVGKIARSGAFGIAGFAGRDIALAGVLARIIAQAASPEEEDWAQAHGFAPLSKRRGVTEFRPHAFTETQHV